MSPRAEVESLGSAEDLVALDPTTLDKTKHYRFVQDRRENISKKKARGYEYVLRSEHGVRLLREDDDAGSADDLIRVGADLVLMMCDKAVYKERRKRIDRLTKDRLGSTEKAFGERARKRGVKSLTGDEGE